MSATYKPMRVGASHGWTYEGPWDETKLAPDAWRVSFRATKTRRRLAPAGSGAGVGTTFDWLIVGRQLARKVDANSYQTLLYGSKRLIGFQAQGAEWSWKDRAGVQSRVVSLLSDELASVGEGRALLLEHPALDLL